MDPSIGTAPQQPSNNIQQSPLKYSAKAIGGVNFLFYGAGYLFLHMYLRFFIMFAIMLFLSAFFGMIGVIVCYIAVIVDTAINAKKIHEGKKELPPVKPILRTIIIGFIILLTLSYFLPKSYLAFSKESCDIFYPIMNRETLTLYSDNFMSNTECKQMVSEGKTLFTLFIEKAPKDAICDAEPYTLKEVCYFKKALDTHNYKYCKNIVLSDICVINLAAIWKDKTMCNNVEGTNYRCDEIVQNCIINSSSEVHCTPVDLFSCKQLASEEITQESLDCMTKYNI